MSETSGKILIIEDERDVADLISHNLQRAGYETMLAHDGLTGQDLALKERPDIIVLDLMLPGKDGFAVFKELRRDDRTSHTPVLMLTARAQTEDRIKGLEAGADDYLTKPFSPKELVLRVSAIMRRTETSPGAVEVSAGPFRLDKNSMSFYLDGEKVELTSTEFKLLLFLVERPDSPQDRNELAPHSVGIFGGSAQPNARYPHEASPRASSGDKAPTMMETVRGIGYRLNVS